MPAHSSTKSSSRWGSFLQQAVAGVESRLDTILADEDIKSSVSPVHVSRDTAEAATKTGSHSEPQINVSQSRKNDHLQERLAKAVVTRSNSRPAVQSSNDLTHSSRPASPGTTPKLEAGMEGPSPFSDDEFIENGAHHVRSRDVPTEEVSETASKGVSSIVNAMLNDHTLLTDPERLSQEKGNPYCMMDESYLSSGNRDTDTTSQLSSPRLTVNIDTSPPVVGGIAKVDSRNLSNEFTSTQWREETNVYMEHIDTLQAKLRYFIMEAAAVSEKAASEAITGSAEEKLALKDERIVHLVEEGQKLSQNELRYTTTIRQLRAKLIEEVRSHDEAKEAITKKSRAAEAAQVRANRAELTIREQADRITRLLGTHNDIEILKAKTLNQESQIVDLRQQLSVAKDTKHQQHFRRLEELLDAEKKKTLALRDDLSNVKIEKELADERQRARLRDLQEKLDYEKEIAKRVESELRTELGILESRLESYRTQAEVASSTDTKYTQAQLLRQTEVLQSQYTIATQNWRGIESSLLAKVASLESEREEIMAKESENRRKTREANIKQRQLEENLQHATRRVVEMQEAMSRQEDKLVDTKKILSRTQMELETTKSNLKDQSTLASRLAENLDKRRASYHEASPTNPEISHHRANPDSSMHSLYSKPSIEKLNYYNRSQPTKPTSGLGNGSATQLDRPHSRRQSTQPSLVSGVASPFHQDSTSHPTRQIPNGNTPETPSIRTEQLEDFFDHTSTPLTPDRTINDVISISTTTAGPSVQLIERMSAAVRRLESEKASSQDELERIKAQRDESRKQVTALMQEIGERQDAREKVKHLKEEVAAINQRYLTTLEMLGERSELVEELQADVTDVKQMYKDLVESTLH